jgi:hypothetical protein
VVDDGRLDEDCGDAFEACYEQSEEIRAKYPEEDE